MGSAHSQCQDRSIGLPMNPQFLPTVGGLPSQGRTGLWREVSSNTKGPLSGRSRALPLGLRCPLLLTPSARQTLAWGRLDPQVRKGISVLPREKAGRAPGQNPSFSPAGGPHRGSSGHSAVCPFIGSLTRVLRKRIKLRRVSSVLFCSCVFIYS